MLTAQVVPVGVDRAICEIITPVVERSVTIACMTTNELILKDFAFEPDDVRLLNVRGPLTALATPPTQPRRRHYNNEHDTAWRGRCMDAGSASSSCL